MSALPSSSAYLRASRASAVASRRRPPASSHWARTSLPTANSRSLITAMTVPMQLDQSLALSWAVAAPTAASCSLVGGGRVGPPAGAAPPAGFFRFFCASEKSLLRPGVMNCLSGTTLGSSWRADSKAASAFLASLRPAPWTTPMATQSWARVLASQAAPAQALRASSSFLRAPLPSPPM